MILLGFSLCLGLVIGALFGMVFGFAMGLLFLFPWILQFMRIAIRTISHGNPFNVSVAFAFFTMLSLVPQAIGQIRYLAHIRRGGNAILIEYKRS
jgi:hypothetical protein